MIDFNVSGCRRPVEEAIKRFQLDLSGLNVLTEAATGYYALTPLIAALAGAERVFGLAKDSRYGKAQIVADQLMGLARQWDLENRVQVLLSREDPQLSEADIVTNLGFVRPLDASFLSRLKRTVVVPLMWETWEFRPSELDLEACRRLQIPVLGTNEEHPELRIFDYLGPLAAKLLFEMDVEVFHSKLVLIGSGTFLTHASQWLSGAGAQVVTFSGAFQAQEALKEIRSTDALVVIEHQSKDLLLGSGGLLDPLQLKNANAGLKIAHICGNADRAALETAGFLCRPFQFAAPGTMSVTLDYLGPRPLIDLHTAGLKVGELLARARKKGLSAAESESLVLRETVLAQGFPKN